MSTPLFTKVVEDFACCNCGETVKGSGYTNHCPKCLWSLHVDNHPGDRAATCKGKMRPIGWSKKHGETIIHLQCERCSIVKKNKVSTDDNFDTICALPPIV